MPPSICRKCVHAYLHLYAGYILKQTGLRICLSLWCLAFAYSKFRGVNSAVGSECKPVASGLKRNINTVMVSVEIKF